MSGGKDAPCRECERRSTGCHRDCIEYARFLERKNAEKRFLALTEAEEYVAEYRKRMGRARKSALPGGKGER